MLESAMTASYRRAFDGASVGQFGDHGGVDVDADELYSAGVAVAH